MLNLILKQKANVVLPCTVKEIKIYLVLSCGWKIREKTQRFLDKNRKKKEAYEHLKGSSDKKKSLYESAGTMHPQVWNQPLGEIKSASSELRKIN